MEWAGHRLASRRTISLHGPYVIRNSRLSFAQIGQPICNHAVAGDSFGRLSD